MSYNRHSGRMTRTGYARMKAQQKRERKAEHQRRLDPFRQTGRIQTAHGRMMDAMLQAMLPGKRRSHAGHRYCERRENRSDRGRYL